uniref:Reverse transcriptase domain-containing protein n=1 Tax=Solanum lycopersicum TaxID=4081 RepID=A0A3Q7HLR0_SOLLC
MLDRLARKGWYYFLDVYSGYNKIYIAPKDQEKTTFTCTYGTFVFRRISFGLCNAPATFQRCMMSIYSDMVEDTIEGMYGLPKIKCMTEKDHFPMPFMDQMLDRLARKRCYYILDIYSGYNLIYIAPKDQEKTTFTCTYGTFMFKRMSLGLCNAPVTFQRCMMSIYSDMVEDTIE